MNIYEELLLSPEFITRFVLEMPPLLLARVTLNQIFGRSPISVDEVTSLALQILGRGWPTSVRQVLTEPEVRTRIGDDIRRLAQEGFWTKRRDGRWVLHLEPTHPADTPGLLDAIGPGQAATRTLRGKGSAQEQVVRPRTAKPTNKRGRKHALQR